jgi:hypothetical protein
MHHFLNQRVQIELGTVNETQARELSPSADHYRKPVVLQKHPDGGIIL